MKSKTTKSAAPSSRFQLKVTLRWSRPAIWRRLVVPSDLRLDRLHHVLQIAMGWTDSHLHQFEADGRMFRSIDPDLWELDDDTSDERDHTVADLVARPKDKFLYEYDFGDGWLHDIVVEKVLPPDPAIKHPLCLAGKNACPPEDCGGVPGYLQLLATLNDPDDPEHESTLDWIGGEWDATAFDLEAVNARLSRVKRKR